METYIQAVAKLGLWMVEAESLLPQYAHLPVRELQIWAGGRLASADDVEVALAGWESIGLVTRENRYIRIDTTAIENTSGYRRGVFAALNATKENRSSVQLCATFEPLTEKLRELFETSFVDLRAVVGDVIACSTEELVLASPFWDHESVSGLADVIRRRLEGGVRLKILSRFGHLSEVPRPLLEIRRDYAGSCSIYSWVRAGTLEQSSTFHFKVAIADRGRKAYLGSANFTTSGFRTRLELGVLFTGQEAVLIHRAVDAVIADALQL